MACRLVPLFPPHRPITNEMCLPVQRPQADSSEHCLSLSKSLPYSNQSSQPPPGCGHLSTLWLLTLRFVQRLVILDSHWQMLRMALKTILWFLVCFIFGVNKTKQNNSQQTSHTCLLLPLSIYKKHPIRYPKNFRENHYIIVVMGSNFLINESSWQHWYAIKSPDKGPRNRYQRLH